MGGEEFFKEEDEFFSLDSTLSPSCAIGTYFTIAHPNFGGKGSSVILPRTPAVGIASAPSLVVLF
jgi:hypothetical protein